MVKPGQVMTGMCQQTLLTNRTPIIQAYEVEEH